MMLFQHTFNVLPTDLYSVGRHILTAKKAGIEAQSSKWLFIMQVRSPNPEYHLIGDCYIHMAESARLDSMADDPHLDLAA